MKKLQKILCAALALALCAGLLSGCGDASSDSLSAGSASASAPDSASMSVPSDSGASSAGSAPQDTAEPIDFSAGMDENGFIEGVRALDLVTLPADYAAIPVPADEVAVTDEDIQAEIDNLAAQFAQPEQITDRAIEDGEYVNINYSGSVDGEKFDGGTADNQRVLSGSNQFIDDFLTQIIGHTPGETFDVEVTFPDPYKNNPDLAGKDAVFEVTVNYIEGESIVPEFDDAFVQEHMTSYYGWETVSDAREEIGQVLYDDALSNFVWNYMMEHAQIAELPEKVREFQSAMVLNRVRSEAQMYGVPVETYLQAMVGVQDEDAFLAAQAQSIEDGAKQQLIIQAIAEDTALSVDDAAIAAYFLENMDTEDYSVYEENFGRPYLCMAVTVEKINAMLTENAVIG